MDGENNWRARTLLAGAIIGALTGLGAAFLLLRRADESDSRPALSAREGVSLGMLVLGLLRQVAQLGNDN